MMSALLGLDFLACFTVTITAGWLLTDRMLSRLARIACAFVAAGACVNSIGICGLLANVDGFRGDVWPSELLVDIGVAALLVRWARRLHRAAEEPVCP